jgi:cell cycle serine/threonine-protein kinase CDC5/MSD2
LNQILDHAFFTQGIVPSYIPMSAHDTAPDFRHISRVVSDANLKRLRRNALLEDDQATRIAVPRPPVHAHAHAAGPGAPLAKSVTSTIAQQEKEFQRAVQPGSPISALLSSARQPLVMSTNTARESPLMRKLQAAAKESPVRARGVRGLQGIAEAEEEEGAVRGRERGQEEGRNKELEAQKARIVAQMAPSGDDEAVVDHGRVRDRRREQENVPPVKREAKGKEKEQVREVVKADAVPGTLLGLAKCVVCRLSCLFHSSHCRTCGQIQWV